MTPEQWLATHLPPTTQLPTAKLYVDTVVVASGHAFIDDANRRGVSYVMEKTQLNPPYPRAMLAVDGQAQDAHILNVEKCTAPMSDHLHFSLE